MEVERPQQLKLKKQDDGEKKMHATAFNGFSPISPTTRVFWNSRRAIRRSALPASGSNSVKTPPEDVVNEIPTKQEESSTEEKRHDSTDCPVLSKRRKSLFQPLEPVKNINGRIPSAEMLLPPPDFDSASYPKGWLIGKKRKLVNVDVVESMRRIAVQEMNRKELL